MSAADRYFTEFLAAKLHQPLIPKLQKLSAVFCIELIDEPMSIWTLTIEDGVLSSITNKSSPAQCEFKLSQAVFIQIAQGKVMPQYAFFHRDVEIKGDIALGLKLATVLAEFFNRFPWSA